MQLEDWKEDKVLMLPCTFKPPAMNSVCSSFSLVYANSFSVGFRPFLSG